MKINRVAWRGYRVPFLWSPVAHGALRASHRHGLLIRITADDGSTGIGEASPIGAGSPTQLEEIAKIIKESAAALLGRELVGEYPRSLVFIRIGMLSAKLFPPQKSSPPARAAGFGLETAMLDLVSRAMGWAFLEPKHPERIQRSAETPIRTNALITTSGYEELATEIELARSQGMTSFKIKVGRRPLSEELETLRAVRELAGSNATIRLDANGLWTPDEAVAVLKRFKPFGIEYIEQPVSPEDPKGLAEVRRRSAVPIAADEAVVSWPAVKKLIEIDAADIFIVKAARLGFHHAVFLTSALTKRNRTVVITSSLESGIGILAAAHLTKFLPLNAPACGLATASLLEHDLLEAPLIVENGCLTLPQGPGIGAAVNPEALERYAVPPKGEVTE
ncbi:MAG: mandelate racemase/muconate lactonizing enzyme family protein [Candidatus Eisenbacteria bacterium]|uniref:Mandelate racemase/muconate lactonizing enzyme family protein n=1 Tax=Eiseniibacteriota bacterium TaxID=2212470 RepID=A0A948RWK7_UNCEI|nr:mandelate racemase/muconate lactonizing enzyme family protein [Candidatus Eisenbacteria bacterium]MBU1947282.1 mandelate racemase/muconate lactonizing enzyme family protein [Candidatus Eisenbacteria bacterium]MBU2691821.1 mandelate racemase/muconate lactonizing enzyme family protein [Candidatus Eisenbacteria bacterium]